MAGRPARDRAARISEDELLGLEHALAVLHDGRVDATVSGSFEAETERAHASSEMQRIRDRPSLVVPITATVFGTTVELGRAVGRLPKVEVIEVPRQTGRYPAVTLRVIIIGSADVSCRLLAPGEQPPPNAIEGPGFGP